MSGQKKGTFGTQDLKNFFMKYDAFILFFFVLINFTSCEENPDKNKIVKDVGCIERAYDSDYGTASYSYRHIKLKGSSRVFAVNYKNIRNFSSENLEGAFEPGDCYEIESINKSGSSSYDYTILKAKLIKREDLNKTTRSENIVTPEETKKDRVILNPEEMPEIKPNSKPIIIILQDGDDKKIMKDFKDTLKKYEDNLEADRLMLEESNI